MSTASHPAPHVPATHMPKPHGLHIPGRKPRSGVLPPTESAEPSPYTRSALPLALVLFVIPAVVLVVSFALR